jgi:hypothetical protein
MGYRQTTLEILARMISWQGFEQEHGLISFRAIKQQSSSMMRLHHVELVILIRGSKGGEIHQNDKLDRNPTRKRNPDKEPSQEDSMVVMRLRVGA